MQHTVRRLLPAVALGGLLASALVAPAQAADPPIVGTAACESAVASDGTVTTVEGNRAKAKAADDQAATAQAAAQTAYDDAKKASDATPTDTALAATTKAKKTALDDATSKKNATASTLSDATKAVNQVRADAQNRLCVLRGRPIPGRPAPGAPGGGPVPGGTSSGSASSTSPTTTASGTLTNDKDCADFATQPEAQRYFESRRTAANPDPDRLDADHDGIACENLADDGDASQRTSTVNPTGDNGTTAATSGTQVTDVPRGSAQTGGE